MDGLAGSTSNLLCTEAKLGWTVYKQYYLDRAISIISVTPQQMMASASSSSVRQRPATAAISSAQQQQHQALAEEELIPKQQQQEAEAVPAAAPPPSSPLYQALTSTANLANLLPTGTLLAFNLLAPTFTNHGACDGAAHARPPGPLLRARLLHRLRQGRRRPRLLRRRHAQGPLAARPLPARGGRRQVQALLRRLRPRRALRRRVRGRGRQGQERRRVLLRAVAAQGDGGGARHPAARRRRPLQPALPRVPHQAPRHRIPRHQLTTTVLYFNYSPIE
jgi:hypothetical protein